MPFVSALGSGKRAQNHQFWEGEGERLGQNCTNTEWPEQEGISSGFIWNLAEFPVGAHPKEFLSSDLITIIPGRNG